MPTLPETNEYEPVPANPPPPTKTTDPRGDAHRSSRFRRPAAVPPASAAGPGAAPAPSAGRTDTIRLPRVPPLPSGPTPPPGPVAPPPSPSPGGEARRRARFRRLRFWTEWAYRHVQNHRVYVSFMAVIVGACAGATALLLRTAEEGTAHGLRAFDVWFSRATGWPEGRIGWLCPAVGLGLTVLLVRYVLRDPEPASVFGVLRAVKTHGYLRFRHILSSVGGCALTLGFGGSVGMEAPAIATGSATGSNLAQVFRMSRGKRALLISCGAAGGIAAIFNAPLAGFLFAMEVLLGGVVVESIVPLLLASVAGNVTARALGGASALFSLELSGDFAARDLAACAGLGILCGLGSAAFLAIFGRVKRGMERIPGVFWRVALAGAALAAMTSIAPSLYGDGIEAMRRVQHNNTAILMERSVFAGYADFPWAVVAYALAIPFLKALATATTLGGGGVGGIFIPCLFMGCFGGWGYARFMNLAAGAHLEEARYVMAGMAGMVAGVVHAPLTAIFLCVENSGGYSWLVPYIVTAAFSYLTHAHFQPYSIYSGGPEAALPAPTLERPSMRY